MISSHIIEKLLFCYLLKNKIIGHVSKCLKFYILHFLYLLCPFCRPKSAARHQNWLWHKNLVKIIKMQVKMAWDPYKSLEPPYLCYCTCHVFSFFNEHEFSIKFFRVWKVSLIFIIEKNWAKSWNALFIVKKTAGGWISILNQYHLPMKLLCPSKFQIYHGWVGIF